MITTETNATVFSYLLLELAKKCHSFTTICSAIYVVTDKH